MPQPPPPPSYTTHSWTQIRTEPYPRSPSIIILTLHRPQHHNAFTTTMMQELETAFSMFDVDDRVRCVVVTGGEGRVFCAGADLDIGFTEKEGEEEGLRAHRDGGGRVALAIARCRKPVIGALNGSAVGVGITMTLPMNIRLAPATAKIGFVFARRGLVMEAVSSFYLPRLIGYSRAMQVVTMGATYRANDPVWGGLFAEVLERGEDVLPRALEMAEEVVGNTSLVSTYLMKEMMWRGRSSPEATHLLDSRILYELFQSADNKEGVESFLQKRKASFTGTMENTALSAYPWWEPVDAAPKSKKEAPPKSKI